MFSSSSYASGPVQASSQQQLVSSSKAVCSGSCENKTIVTDPFFSATSLNIQSFEGYLSNFDSWRDLNNTMCNSQAYSNAVRTKSR